MNDTSRLQSPVCAPVAKQTTTGEAQADEEEEENPLEWKHWITTTIKAVKASLGGLHGMFPSKLLSTSCAAAAAAASSLLDSSGDSSRYPQSRRQAANNPSPADYCYPDAFVPVEYCYSS